MILCPWDFPGKKTGVGSYFFLQGIFLTQALNLCSLHWQADSLPVSHLVESMERERKKKEKLNKAKLHRMFKFESTVRSHNDSSWPWYNMMPAHHFWGLPHKTHSTDLIMRKTSEKSQWRNVLQDIYSAILKSAKLIKNREKPLGPRGASGDMMTTRNGVSWRGFWTRKMTLGEHWITQELCCCGHSVAKSCLTLCGPMDCNTRDFPVLHQLLEPAQTHVHWISDAIQPSHPLSSPLHLPSFFSSIRIFSNESALGIRWPKYWSFSFRISFPSKYSGLISFRTDWFDLLAVQGTRKSLLQHHNLKASVLHHSAFLRSNSHIHT